MYDIGASCMDEGVMWNAGMSRWGIVGIVWGWEFSCWAGDSGIMSSSAWYMRFMPKGLDIPTLGPWIFSAEFRLSLRREFSFCVVLGLFDTIGSAITFAPIKRSYVLRA